MGPKGYIKKILLEKLHARPEIVSRVSKRIVEHGVPAYLNWNFETEKKQTLDFLESRRVGDFSYTFSETVDDACLYNSIYAFLLCGLYGELDSDRERMNSWVDFIDEHQTDSDGLFRDPILAGSRFEGEAGWGDGWGARHLTAHLPMVYVRAGRVPRYRLAHLEPFYDLAFTNKWLAGFDFGKPVWPQSNEIMNVVVLLQFSRDYMLDAKAGRIIMLIQNWLLAKQSLETGLWHENPVDEYPELGDAVRAAYHFFPLFTYDGIAVPNLEKVIRVILSSQNRWGGFNPEDDPSGACEDIDAIEPLVRFSNQVRDDESIEASIRKAMIWTLTCRGEHGGYESIPEHGCEYGEHPLTTSQPGEANLFATWFRTLAIAYMVKGLGFPNDYRLVSAPGYEQQLDSR